MSVDGYTTYSMILCQLLLTEMQRIAMPQSRFFELSGVSQATWSRIARGQAHFSVEDLRRACETLGLEMADLTASADKVARELPREKVEVVDKKKSGAGPVIGAMLAGAALAFLIGRILRS